MSSTESNSAALYRLPTRPVEARLILSNGKQEEVTLFLATVTEPRRAPESLDEFLSGSRRFIPVESKNNGKRLLVNLDSLQRIEVGDDAPVLLRTDANSAPCVDLVRIEMMDDVVLEGTLASILPPERGRMSDFFNMEDTFIALEVEEGVTYVNKRYIAKVWL